jgi:hypothetical protein
MRTQQIGYAQAAVQADLSGVKDGAQARQRKVRKWQRLDTCH